MITQKKIAKALGISTSTVANILNGTPNYSKETREKVFKAVADFGYQPNRASRAVSRGRSNLIGVIYSGSAYEVGQRAVCSLLPEIAQSDYDYLVVDLHWYAKDAVRVINEMVAARVEGVLLCADIAASFEADSFSILRRAGIPVVSLYGENPLNVPVVEDSAASSFYSLTRHLQEVGHRKILLMPGPLRAIPFRSTEGRISGFKAAIKGWGECFTLEEKEFIRAWPKIFRDYRDRHVGVIVYPDKRHLGKEVARRSYEISRNILASGSIPDAIMATNDRGAFGIFSAAQEIGIRVPGELAITGADDDSLSDLSLFRLTTIRQDVARSSKAAVEMLLACIQKQPCEDIQCFPSQLVLRQSCGRLVSGDEDAVLYLPTEPCPGHENLEV